MYRYRLTYELRRLLKRPLGSLISGTSEETMKCLSNFIHQEDPPKVIAVGDFVMMNMIRSGINTDVYVFDAKVMRKPIVPLSPYTDKIISVKNPPGTISIEAWKAVCEASMGPSKVSVVVDGEEDLLALPAIICAPVGSFVVYGQPHIGIVLVRVTKIKKREIEILLGEMEVTERGDSLEKLK